MNNLTQDIRGFYQRASVKDFSRDFLFRVTNINIVATNNEANNNKSTPLLNWGSDELVYVRTAALPGRNINNVEAKYMGLTFNVPGAVTYPNSNAYSLEFYCDSLSNLREELMDVSRATFDDETSSGLYATPGPESYITLQQLDKDLAPVTEYKLVGISVRDVGEISYEIAEGTGNYKIFPVTFAYHFFENKSTVA